MQTQNLDFDISLTNAQWEQLGRSAATIAEKDVMRWTPDEPDVIHLSIRDGDRPDGWSGIVPPLDDLPPEEREVARFLFNGGRPYAHLEPPGQPEPPAILPQDDEKLQRSYEHWVRGKWHELLRISGLHYE